MLRMITFLARLTLMPKLALEPEAPSKVTFSISLISRICGSFRCCAQTSVMVA